jgi:hypothetical protein
MASKIADLVLVYQFLKRLTTPFNETPAFDLGIIDERGQRIKSKELKTTEEKNAYGYFDRLVFNVKKLLERLPGGKNRLASYAAALFLIKEAQKPEREYTAKDLQEGFDSCMKELEKRTMKNLKDLVEDAPANSSGAAVAGTGDDSDTVVVKKKKKQVLIDRDGRRKDMRSYIKSYMERRTKRDQLKKREDFRKIMGI